MISDRALAVKMYRTMRLIRQFENRVVELVNANEIASVTHEYTGQEAVAVGVCSALREDDVITSTHRGHGHIIAKGGDVKRMLAELMGRATGYNKGKGGSMHIADLSLGIYGANGIVGAGAPIAAGAAWVLKAKKSGRVAVPFFGEGAMAQGVLYEAMNMAAIWKLPVVFVCDNNRYAVTTSIDSVSPVEVRERALAHGFPGYTVDGMDVQAVYEATTEAVARARAGDGPTLLDCRAYRYSGHHTAEAAMKLGYRTDEEIESWRQRDPVESWGRRLLEAGVLSKAERDAIDREIDERIEEAVEFARNSPWPDPEDALEDMYATPHPALPDRGWM